MLITASSKAIANSATFIFSSSLLDSLCLGCQSNHAGTHTHIHTHTHTEAIHEHKQTYIFVCKMLLCLCWQRMRECVIVVRLGSDKFWEDWNCLCLCACVRMCVCVCARAPAAAGSPECGFETLPKPGEAMSRAEWRPLRDVSRSQGH